MGDQPRFQNFIGGEWVDAEGGATTPNLNPADTSDVIGHFARGSRSDARAAIDAAKAAFPAWRATSPPDRGRIFARAAAIILQRRDELARILCREEGKTLLEARGEITKGMNLIEFYAGEGFRLGGVTRPSEMKDTLLYTVRQPLGVVGLVTPWNFPWAIPVWKSAPAMVAGNTVVIKPAELTPHCVLKLAEILVEAGLPRGVFNVVVGKGSEVGDEITKNPAVRVISFTGSTPIGLALYAEAAKRGIRVTCEMGGKNPVVVMADADLDQAAQGIADGAFGSTGQRCTATSRLLVERKVHDELVAKIVQKAKAHKVGNGQHQGVTIGPAVDDKQLQTDLRYIDIAKREGGEIVCGGRRLTDGDLARGFFVEPTVVAGVKAEHTIAREEVFGPVLSVIAIDSLDEGIAVSNGVEFGLTCSIYARDSNAIMKYVAEVEAGMVHVNSPTVGGEAQIPFGGVKATGVGEREMAEEGIRFFTEQKTVFYDYTGAVRKTNIY